MQVKILGLMIVFGATASSGLGWTVFVPEDASEPVLFAGQELSRYCSEIFNLDIALCRTPHMATNSVALAKGDLSEPEEAPPTQSVTTLGEEGISIQASSSLLRISGGCPRAVLFGAYTFLEDHLGCRWFMPDPVDQIVPRLPMNRLEKILKRGISRQEVPDFAFRQREFRDVTLSVEGTDEKIIEQIDWWAKLRMNRFLINFGYASDPGLWNRWKVRLFPEIKKRGLLLGVGEHGSYPLFLPPSQYAQEHPDWYCEIDHQRVKGFRTSDNRTTQFCTSNPEAVSTYLDNLVVFLKANPEIDYIYPAPNDMGLWCECEACSKMSVADRYLILDNAIALRLAEINPSYSVLHLAYANHRLPPEHTVPHRNIVVDVACWGRDFAWPLSDPRTMKNDPDYLSVFKEWIKVCDGAGCPVIYHCKFMRHLWLSFRLLPLEVLNSDMRYVKEMGLAGFDFPLGFVGIWTKAPNAYAVARKCWNTDESAHVIGEEVLRLYFGTAAKDARQTIHLIEEALPSLQYGSNPALVWQSCFTQPHSQPMPDLKESAERAVAKLTEAVQNASEAANLETDPVTKTRLVKLEKATRQVLGEQQILLRIACISEALSRWEKANTDEVRRQCLQEAQDAAEEGCSLATQFARSYDVSDDLHGLLWLGNSGEPLCKAMPEWKRQVEIVTQKRDWNTLGHWQTSDFPDADTVISMELDATEFLTEAGTIFVRWKWTGGELGVDISETSLWEITNGESTCLSQDTHKGFTGWQDREPIYSLELKSLTPGSQYRIKGRLKAYTTRGTVKERGTEGVVLIAGPKGIEDP